MSISIKQARNIDYQDFLYCVLRTTGVGLFKRGHIMITFRTPGSSSE
jgi:hypothetical protein